MPNVIPSPPSIATGTRSGLVSLGAQTLGAGVKTFQDKAVINVPTVDTAAPIFKIGTSQVYGAGVPDGARFFEIWTRLGSTESKRFGISHDAVYNGINLYFPQGNITSNSYGLSMAHTYASVTVASNTISLYHTYGGGFGFNGSRWNLGAAAGGQVVFYGPRANATDQFFTVGTSVADSLADPAAKLFKVSTGIDGTEVEKFTIKADGSAVLNLAAASGTGYANPGFRIPLNGVSQSYAFVLGGNTVNTWEFALGFWTGGLTTTITTRSEGILFSLPANKALRSGGDGTNDLGVAGAAWRDLYLKGSVRSSITLGLYSSLGALATDIATKIGTSVVDASIHATAKIASFRGGLGGTETEYAWLTKSAFGGTVFRGTSSSAGFVSCDDGAGTRIVYSGCELRVTSGGTTVYGVMQFGGIPTVVINTTGRIDQVGVDSSGAPGAQTANKPIGKNAIAAGASSVVVTNSLVTAASTVLITAHARDATCKELIAVAAAGSFTVSGTANATAAIPFSWQIAGILP